MLRYAVTTGQRARVRRVTEGIGRVIRHLESCSGQVASNGYFPRMAAPLLLDKVQAQGHLSNREVASLHDRINAMHEQADLEGEGFVYAHCDLSPQNMILEEGGVGIYDAQFEPRLRGYDIAHLAFRLEYQTVVTSWSRALIDALLEGYGDSGVTTSTGWRFARLWLALRFVQNVRWTRPAMKEIRPYL